MRMDQLVRDLVATYFYNTILLLTSNGYGSTLHSTIFDTLRVFWAILDSVGSISISSAQRTCIGTENWAGDFALRILQVVRSVETFALTIIAAKYTNLGGREWTVILQHLRRTHLAG